MNLHELEQIAAFASLSSPRCVAKAISASGDNLPDKAAPITCAVRQSR